MKKIMSETETNSIGKIMEVETTEADGQEMRENGIPESEIPEIGSKRRYIRARHIANRSDQKIKVELFLEADILDFLKNRSDESYEKQINSELRKLMEKENVFEIKSEILNDKDFLRQLRDKLKAA